MTVVDRQFKQIQLTQPNIANCYWCSNLDIIMSGEISGKFYKN